MTAETLDSPIVTGGALRSVNFFNGRLLTGDDLRREQSTLRSRLARLGRAAGEGVAYGLEVKETIGTSAKGKPVVTVAAGLALARSGQALELAAPVDVALARARPVAGSETGGLFADCQPFADGTYTAGAGVYLLAIAPAQQGEGHAQVSGIANEPAPCNVAASVEAVRFRLIRLALSPAELNDKAHLRNRVAYACFGADALTSFTADPFGPAWQRYGLVDTLREQTLGDDEVPLAVLGWTMKDGIQFVDLWSVRRRIVRRESEGPFAELLSDRRQAEGEAMFFQFQGQLRDRGRKPKPASARLRDEFVFLPAAGLVPTSDASGTSGFDIPRFFENVKTRGPFFVGAQKVRRLALASFQTPPIDIDEFELVWLYQVRENRDGRVAGAGIDRPYVAFASGFLPYAASAQHDLARWDFANYALPAS
jgi:hypothetical protein